MIQHATVQSISHLQEALIIFLHASTHRPIDTSHTPCTPNTSETHKEPNHISPSPMNPEPTTILWQLHPSNRLLETMSEILRRSNDFHRVPKDVTTVHDNSLEEQFRVLEAESQPSLTNNNILPSPSSQESASTTTVESPDIPTLAFDILTVPQLTALQSLQTAQLCHVGIHVCDRRMILVTHAPIRSLRSCAMWTARLLGVSVVHADWLLECERERRMVPVKEHWNVECPERDFWKEENTVVRKETMQWTHGTIVVLKGRITGDTLDWQIPQTLQWIHLLGGVVQHTWDPHSRPTLILIPDRMVHSLVVQTLVLACAEGVFPKQATIGNYVESMVEKHGGVPVVRMSWVWESIDCQKWVRLEPYCWGWLYI